MPGFVQRAKKRAVERALVVARGQANIARVKVELPKALPSRLTTLQKACTAQVFEANPANCPAASRVGYAKATTPILPVALTGTNLINSPRLNKGTAFDDRERDEFELHGLLPPHVGSLELQVSTAKGRAGVARPFLLLKPSGPYLRRASHITMSNSPSGSRGASRPGVEIDSHL